MLYELHNIQLEMLDEFNRLCVKYNLSYWLDSGSALGAVRHKGFIPWDDDVDIGMMRKDYDKFLSVAREELSSDYVIQDINSEPLYKNFHIKIRKLNSVFPQSYTADYKYRGIQLDVFPFDYVLDNSEKTVKKCKRIQKYRDLCDRVTKKVTSHNPLKRIIHRILKIVPENVYRNRFERLCQKYNGYPYEYVTSHTYRMQRTKIYIFKAEDMLPVKQVPFEDREYFIMNNPDAYLKIMYGDYMVLPPIEKRECHLIGEVIFDTSKLKDNQ